MCVIYITTIYIVAIYNRKVYKDSLIQGIGDLNEKGKNRTQYGI